MWRVERKQPGKAPPTPPTATMAAEPPQRAGPVTHGSDKTVPPAPNGFKRPRNPPPPSPTKRSKGTPEPLAWDTMPATQTPMSQYESYRGYMVPVITTIPHNGKKALHCGFAPLDGGPCETAATFGAKAAVRQPTPRVTTVDMLARCDALGRQDIRMTLLVACHDTPAGIVATLHTRYQHPGDSSVSYAPLRRSDNTPVCTAAIVTTDPSATKRAVQGAVRRLLKATTMNEMGWAAFAPRVICAIMVGGNVASALQQYCNRPVIGPLALVGGNHAMVGLPLVIRGADITLLDVMMCTRIVLTVDGTARVEIAATMQREYIIAPYPACNHMYDVDPVKMTSRQAVFRLQECNSLTERDEQLIVGRTLTVAQLHSARRYATLLCPATKKKPPPPAVEVAPPPAPDPKIALLQREIELAESALAAYRAHYAATVSS